MEHGRGTIAVLTPVFRTVDTTGSTNADLLRLAATDVAEGLWLRAERQSAGRGRQGRAWVSPPGNLYASTLVRLRPADPPAPTLALAAAVALHETVAACLDGSTDLQLKWPNDLLLGGAKLSGILLERAGDAVVVGFGVNLMHYPTDLDRPATSLAAYRQTPDPDRFVRQLARSFTDWRERWAAQGLAPVRERWLAGAHPPGTALTARLPDGTALAGRFDGLGTDGSLLLRLADGERRVIHAGDVFLT